MWICTTSLYPLLTLFAGELENSLLMGKYQLKIFRKLTKKLGLKPMLSALGTRLECMTMIT